VKRQPTKNRHGPKGRPGGRRRTTWTKETVPNRKGHGRTKGAKDKWPRSFPGTMKALYLEYARGNAAGLMQAIHRGIHAPAPKSFQYLQLFDRAIDGNDADVVPFERVRQLVLSMMALFLEVVADAELRRRYADGVRRITGLTEGAIVDAEPASKS